MVPLLKTLVYIYYNHGSQQEKDDKTNKMTCASSEDSDQPGHRPVFAVRMKKPWAVSHTYDIF